MRRFQSPRVPLFLLLAGMALLLLVPELFAAIGANQPARIPPLLVKDNNGAVVGAAVGFDGFRPLVLLEDGSTHVLLRAERENLATTHRVFYTNGDCTGTAYLPTFNEAASIDAFGSLDEMQQTVYGVGKPNGANTLGVLYKGSPASTATPSTNSEWISVNPASSRCFSAMRSGEQRFVATAVQDLDALFDTPLTVE